jgi:hypothetical protein
VFLEEYRMMIDQISIRHAVHRKHRDDNGSNGVYFEKWKDEGAEK